MTSTEEITIGRNPTLTVFVTNGLRRRKDQKDKRDKRKATFLLILDKLGIATHGLSI
jgi:hypothetical protein